MTQRLRRALGTMLPALLALSLHAQKQVDAGASYTPANSTILLVDHQKLTMDWLQSMPRAPGNSKCPHAGPVRR